MLHDPAQWYYVGRCVWCSATLYIKGDDYTGGHKWVGGDPECSHVLGGDWEDGEGGVN